MKNLTCGILIAEPEAEVCVDTDVGIRLWASTDLIIGLGVGISGLKNIKCLTSDFLWQTEGIVTEIEQSWRKRLEIFLAFQTGWLNCLVKAFRTIKTG